MNPDRTEYEAVFRSASAEALREHALVLQAREIEFVNVSNAGEYVLAVPLALAARAREELWRYEEENRGWPRRTEAPAFLSNGKLGAALYAVAIAAMFLVDHGRTLGVAWDAAGRASARLIRSGEWWRTFTALTLHTDLSHLVSNLLFGAVFSALACQLLGTGLGLSGILVAGALGNAANAFVQDPEHLAVGASTAVFGAIGLQTGYLWIDRRRRRYSALYVWAPIVFGVVFLAFLGMPSLRPEEVLEHARQVRQGMIEERTDFMSHAMGFAGGLLLGALASRIPHALVVRPDFQRAAGVFGLLLLGAAWSVALIAS